MMTFNATHIPLHERNLLSLFSNFPRSPQCERVRVRANKKGTPLAIGKGFLNCYCDVFAISL
jgi:hypothetical protein